MKKIIPYGKQTIRNDDVKIVTKTLKSDYLTTGPMTLKFENMFKKFVGSKYSSSCSSGTSALHLSLLAINFKKGDIIILPVINFIASINMSYLIGAKLYFADVDKYTGQMSPKNLEDFIKKNKIKKIKAIITMHNGGNPANAELFYKLKKKYKFIIIEDACHSLGGKYDVKNNIKVGSCKYSDITTFSLHPIKSITTGEGGMITTNNKTFYKKINLLKNHGIFRKLKKNKNNWNYKIVLPGYNYRLSDLSCSLGISQLAKINIFIKKRNQISNFYRRQLSKFTKYLDLPPKHDKELSANHLFVILFKKETLKISRERIIQELYKNGIVTQIHYIPIFFHPFYKKICRGKFDGANYYFNNCLSLPIFPSIKKEGLNRIIYCLENIIRRHRR